MAVRRRDLSSSDGVPQTRIMRDVGRLPLDEFAQESELDVVGHEIGWALDVAFLHEEFEVAHRLVFELLKPLVQLHMILIRPRIVVLPSPCLSPVGLC